MTVFEQVKSAVDMRTVAEGYGLEISRGGMALCPFHAEKVTEYQKRVREKRAYEEWEKSAWRTLNDYLWLMREWREFAPTSPNEECDERFVYSLHHLDYAEYLCLEFINYNKAGRLSMKNIVAEIADFQDNLRADFSKL